MQAKGAVAGPQIKAAINKCIGEIERFSLISEETRVLDDLVAMHKVIFDHIDHAQRNGLNVDIGFLKEKINDYQSFLLRQTDTWLNDPKRADRVKLQVVGFEKKVSREIEALQKELSQYQLADQNQAIQGSAPQVASIPEAPPRAGFTTVNPQPLPAALAFIDQLKACSPGGTVTEKGSSPQSISYEIKYPAISTIKNITVTRSEAGQVSTRTDNPNPKTLKEMLSILENLEPKGKKALKIDAQDKETLQTIHDLAISEGHTVNLTDAQKQTLEMAEPPRPASPK